MKVDISALLGGDIYAALRQRSQHASSRFARERDDQRALEERKRCLAKLQAGARHPGRSDERAADRRRDPREGRAGRAQAGAASRPATGGRRHEGDGRPPRPRPPHGDATPTRACCGSSAGTSATRACARCSASRSGSRRGEYFPPFLYISIINSCNLRCQGCWVKVDGPREIHPDADKLDRLITDAKRQGNSFFGILGGEPFMHPELLDRSSSGTPTATSRSSPTAS